MAKPSPKEPMVADRPLYLAADERRLVDEGDPDAKYLLANLGQVVSSDAVERLGLSLDGARVIQERSGEASAKPTARPAGRRKAAARKKAAPKKAPARKSAGASARRKKGKGE